MIERGTSWIRALNPRSGRPHSWRSPSSSSSPTSTAGASHLVWTGACYEDDRLCPTCYQPECPGSGGGARPPAGDIPSRLTPGHHEYRGYSEWAVHPDEARIVLHRGYAIVDGEKRPVRFIHNEAFVTQIAITPKEPDAA